MRLYLRLLTIITLLSATELLYSAEKKESSEKTISSTQTTISSKLNKMIFVGIARNSIDLVKKALEQGADINFIDSNGYSFLMYASHKGYLSIVNLLIDNGAKINIQDNDGCTALMLAIENEHEEVAKALFEASITEKLYLKGQDALALKLQATQAFKLLEIPERKLSSELYYIIQALKADKIDINDIKDDNGNTLLMEIIKAIANIDALNQHKATLIDLPQSIYEQHKQYLDRLKGYIQGGARREFTENHINNVIKPAAKRLEDQISNFEKGLINENILEKNYKFLMNALKALLPYVKDFYVRDNEGSTVFDLAEKNPEITTLLNQALERREAFVKQHMNEHLVPELQDIVYGYGV